MKNKRKVCYYCNKPHCRASSYCSQSCASKQFWKEVRIKYKKFEPKIGDKENINGYIRIWNGIKWVLEHRYIFEQHLRRKLMKSEIIHHRDGNKANNNLENLQLLTKKTHCPQIETKHSEDICKLLYRIKNLEGQLGIKEE